MNQDFIQIKELEGELKISHKLKDLGLTVSTKELVVQRPHINYRFNLEDIISIVPYVNSNQPKKMNIVREGSMGLEVTELRSSTRTYKIDVKSVRIQNRSGIFNLERTEIIIPIGESLLNAIVKHGNMTGLQF